MLFLSEIKHFLQRSHLKWQTKRELFFFYLETSSDTVLFLLLLIALWLTGVVAFAVYISFSFVWVSWITDWFNYHTTIASWVSKNKTFVENANLCCLKRKCRKCIVGFVWCLFVWQRQIISLHQWLWTPIHSGTDVTYTYIANANGKRRYLQYYLIYCSFQLTQYVNNDMWRLCDERTRSIAEMTVTINGFAGSHQRVLFSCISTNHFAAIKTSPEFHSIIILIIFEHYALKCRTVLWIRFRRWMPLRRRSSLACKVQVRAHQFHRNIHWVICCTEVN